jgi:hypothetical protein
MINRRACCGSCRYWDRLSLTSSKGDCRGPNAGAPLQMSIALTDGTRAFLDGGTKEMRHTDTCADHDTGKYSVIPAGYHVEKVGRINMLVKDAADDIQKGSK